ncbi:MAG: FAD-dependent monooxygenase [Pseudomonadota bacterium]|nr:FAD-dependent monooxygenase [Pseudomonadota bacterium]
MTRQVLIAGGGIGGLAAALAASRAGWDVRLYERAPAFSEVGAGVQLGPNVVRLLHGWGLQGALARVAAFPQRLQVRDAVSGRELGVLALGERALDKYGAPYVTIHRADLHGLLLQALQGRDNLWLKLNTCLCGYTDTGREVTLKTTGHLTKGRLGGLDSDGAPALADLADADEGLEVEGDALIGADGLWSRVRELMLGDGPPRVTGHLAYRAMLPQAGLPEQLRSQQVTAWLGPKLHAVQYPVRGGEWLNLVVIVQGQAPGDLQSWDHQANGADLQAAIQVTCAPLRELIEAVTAGAGTTGPAWRLWPLSDRPPISGAHQQAKGRVALLGDAAHPMRPYLAQGAGMAIEDAAELGSALAQALDPAFDVPTLLQRYALNRWQRNARVQARSVRNGELFHAEGPLRWGRDAGMKLLGEKVLDLPWLYGAMPRVV